MQTIYIERNIKNHPRVNRILAQLNPTHIIECEHYKEIFNVRMQNFRIQKQNPAIILAEKKGKMILPSPPNFGIGGHQNFYFSHMLNCLYDCRYCFLQGMYPSAYYVIFVNYEDFMQEIEKMQSTAEDKMYFFSGYDCDSLAFEPVTHFVKEFLPFFRPLKNAIVELRTKSTNIHTLLKQDAYSHCVVAFSFTPHEISSEIEHNVPSVKKRLAAMQKVAEKGWPIGLRFDPLIYHPDFKAIYHNLIENIFSKISKADVHSVSVGPLRFPTHMYQKIVKLYPNDKLLAQPLYQKNNVVSYDPSLETEMKNYIYDLLKEHIESTILFECQT